MPVDDTGRIKCTLDPAVHYRTIRDRIKNEESLIANRLGWFIATEAFLVTAFAIVLTKAPTFTSLVMALLLPVLGLLLVARVSYPIHAAYSTIDIWLRKEREFFDQYPSFAVLDLKERDPALHWRSWLFPQQLPWFFAGFWIILLAARLFQLAREWSSVPFFGD